MAMKILLLAVLVMVLGHGMVESCRRSTDKKIMRKLTTTTRCNKPQEALVQLPVPTGFDFVRPNVVKLNQCTGLSCQVFPEKCLPSPGRITTKTYKVYAFRVEDHIPHCVEVEVEEHGDCECRCEKTDCPYNKIFNEEICECECSHERRFRCEERRNEGESVMWSRETCSCLCDNPLKCDSSMIWVEELCRCVDEDYLDYSNEI